MSLAFANDTQRNLEPDRFGSGFAFAVLGHVLLAAAIVCAVLFGPLHSAHWGSDEASAGAIQASMVSAIPLPQKAAPVEKQVLASEHTSEAPQPPPKEATQPPPKPNDIEVKAPTKPAKVAPVEAPAPPKHPQPAPPTPKATTGEAATQLPQSVTQLKNGTGSITVPDRVFGNRFAYYIRIIGQKVAENYITSSIDPRAAGHAATVVFDIERDGTVANLRMETRSGFPSLDTAAMQAIQRIDTFGPLPAGDHITIEYKIEYHP